MEVHVLSETKQRFDGTTYYLCGQYFQKQGKRLHRTVWAFFHGEIPDGHDVHHVNGDRTDNRIANLALMPESEHLSYHGKRLAHLGRAIKAAQDAARVWHGSEEGLKFHSRLAKESWGKREPRQYACSQCGRTFETKHYYGKDENHFCSNACKSAYRLASGVDNVGRKCPACGSVFTANKYSRKRFCSRRCGRLRGKAV